jgi:hypothetical protein
MRSLTYPEFMALPLAERKLLRRLAFGAAAHEAFRVKPEQLTEDQMATVGNIQCMYDLAYLRRALEEHNEQTGWMPEPWGLTKEEMAEDETARMAERLAVDRKLRP